MQVSFSQENAVWRYGLHNFILELVLLTIFQWIKATFQGLDQTNIWVFLTLTTFFSKIYSSICMLLYNADIKMWNASRFCVSSLRRGHANLLCIVPILVYVLPKQYTGVSKTNNFNQGWYYVGLEIVRIYFPSKCFYKRPCKY